MFAARTDAGGIDQDKLISAVSVGDINGIACRAGKIAHDGTSVTQDGVDERGFSDVRPAHDGEGQRRNFRFLIFNFQWRKQALDHLD